MRRLLTITIIIVIILIALQMLVVRKLPINAFVKAFDHKHIVEVEINDSAMRVFIDGAEFPIRDLQEDMAYTYFESPDFDFFLKKGFLVSIVYNIKGRYVTLEWHGEEPARFISQNGYSGTLLEKTHIPVSPPEVMDEIQLVQPTYYFITLTMKSGKVEVKPDCLMFPQNCSVQAIDENEVSDTFKGMNNDSWKILYQDNSIYIQHVDIYLMSPCWIEGLNRLDHGQRIWVYTSKNKHEWAKIPYYEGLQLGLNCK